MTKRERKMYMAKNSKYNYNKAEADLYDVGCRHPEEVYEYHSEKSFRSYMKEHGLNPDKYIKPDKNKKPSGSSSSGCYLTTACVVSKGLPDDCAELQTLRAFRDSYLAALPNGKAEIEQYYQMAPGIVATINKRNDREEIWNQVYADLVEPCVRMIHAQENESAHQLYKAYSLELSQKYGN